MGLRSALELVLSADQPLNHLHQFVWQSLKAGASSSRHPWNWGVVSTVDSSGRPNSRTVILRDALGAGAAIDFHTDVRSSKVTELANPSVAWVFYAESQKIQLRLTGSSEVINDARADSEWKETPLRSRSAYVSLLDPGLESPGEVPPSTQDREVDEKGSERGRDNFRIVRTYAREIDLLYLRSGGHVRARLSYENRGSEEPTVSSCWLVP